MDILTVDFETFYDSEYSLRKMTTIEYIMDGRFQPILMSYALNNEPVDCAIGFSNIKTVLDKYDWNKIILNAQNTQFDGTILAQRFGKVAAFYTDTMAMARVTGAHTIEGASLNAISNVLRGVGINVPPKGTIVKSAVGMHLFDMYSDMPYLALERQHTKQGVLDGHNLLKQYIQYCNDDVELARQAFSYFVSQIPKDEMKYGDMILKCYIKPSTYLDRNIIEDEIIRIQERDKQRAKGVADKYFKGDIKELRSVCRSAPKFTKFLTDLGGVLVSQSNYSDPDTLIENTNARFVIPERYSEKKGVVEPCYSKAFSGMIDMCDHPDPEIAQVFSTKLDMTSSFELSRAKRFKAIADLDVGFGFPYTVSGAHTHRLGGAGGLNVQNLSSGRKEGQSKALKQAITAPDGYKIVVFDSSQVELRCGAYIADDTEFLDVFRTGGDPYSNLAASLYGGDPVEIKTNAKKDIQPYAMQRQIGKSAELSCIYGTGKVGFRNYLKINGIDMPEDECQDIVQGYRVAHPKIVQMWDTCKKAIYGMMSGGSGYFGGPSGNLFYYTGQRNLHGYNVPGIRLPDGNWLNYRDLTRTERKLPDGSFTTSICYTGMKEGRVKQIYTHPAKLFENIVQAFAFAVMKYQALLVNNKYQVILNTHDEWGICVPDEQVEQAQEYMQWCMRQVPVWATGLPVDCEGSYAQHYGDCK